MTSDGRDLTFALWTFFVLLFLAEGYWLYLVIPGAVIGLAWLIARVASLPRPERPARESRLGLSAGRFIGRVLYGQ